VWECNLNRVWKEKAQITGGKLLPFVFLEGGHSKECKGLRRKTKNLYRFSQKGKKEAGQDPWNVFGEGIFPYVTYNEN